MSAKKPYLVPNFYSRKIKFATCFMVKLNQSRELIFMHIFYMNFQRSGQIYGANRVRFCSLSIFKQILHFYQGIIPKNRQINMLFLYSSNKSQFIYMSWLNFFGLCCTGSPSKKVSLDPTSKYYGQIQKTLSNHEQAVLELIYHDLATRHHDRLLTLQNFLLFFGLTGLWGAKLFRQFDQSDRQLITKQEFFYGLSRTTKAPHYEKINQLFNFFKDKEDNGIKYIDFTKMLYNYSRDELKEIIMEDTCMLSQLNKNLIQKVNLQGPPLYQTSQSSILQHLQKTPKNKIIQLDYEQPKELHQTCFQKHYSKFSQYKDPGTIFQLKLNDLTYKVNYCNMITLVKEFAKRTYKNYHIDIKTGKYDMMLVRFTLQQFAEWIQSHKKLFQSYYTSFHIDIWSYCDSEPNFLNKVDKSFTGKIKIGDNVSPIYAMLVQDVLIIAQSRKKRQSPFKIVFLEGLNLRDLQDQNGYGIEISHRDEYYEKFTIYFRIKEELYQYLECFSIYAGQTLHDLYNTHEVIGTGTFSIVYRCTEKQTGLSFALKDISTEKLTKQAIALLNNQTQIMKVVTHPQIVNHQQTIRSKAHIYIIAEYIHGKDLFTFVIKRKRLSQYVSAFIIGKIIEAIMYLHSLQILHRDLKPENIMVMLRPSYSPNQKLGQGHPNHQDQIENIKIIDFGFANHLSSINNTKQKKGITGTPNYIAPEIINGDPATLKSDIFSIGAILYFLLSGKLAFAFQSMQYTLLLTLRGEYDLESEIWQSVSPEAKDLIMRMLEPNPQKRISLEDAINHTWFEVAKKEKKEVNSRPVKPQELCTGESSSDDKLSECENIQIQSTNEVNVKKYLQSQLQKKTKMSRI